MRNLLLGETNMLQNRDLHISGLLAAKQDIDAKKQDIDAKKQDIGDVLSAHVRAQAEKLETVFGSETVFSRRDVIAVLGITASPASALIQKVLEAQVIAPVSGQGKGRYRFQ